MPKPSIFTRAENDLIKEQYTALGSHGCSKLINKTPKQIKENLKPEENIVLRII
jgi:hypothetical protein